MKSTTQIFEERRGLYLGVDLHNGVDCLISPRIPKNKKQEARRNFEIGYDENILWIRDTSFKRSVNEGTVVTNIGIYWIDNDKRGCVKWDNMERIWYQELIIHILTKDGNDNTFSVNEFINEYDEEKIVRAGINIAHLFNEMLMVVHPVQSKFETSIDTIDKLLNEGKKDDAILTLRQCIDEQPECVSFWYEWIGEIYYFEFLDYNQAIEACEASIQMHKDINPNMWIYEAMRTLYLSYWQRAKKKDDIFDYLKARILASKLAVDVKNDEDDEIRQHAIKDLYALDNAYNERFLNRPYNERKIIMPVRQYPIALNQESINVLNIKNLPSELDFPIGHPIANQLYIGHPFLPHKYLPFDNYQLELIDDKVREFCSIVQALGATNISVECLNSQASESEGSQQKGVGGHVNYKLLEINGSYNDNYSRRLMEELSHSLQLHQTFSPISAPKLPANLVWYENEPSWKRLYNQRMSGNLLSHEERVESRKSQMIDGREMKEIKGEIKTLITSVGGAWTKDEEEKYQIQENAVLSIKVKFAPLSELTGKKELAENKSVSVIEPESNMLIKEQEYLDELRECLADGNIGNSERRLLNKLRIKLEISEERAKELEDSLHQPQLTDAEQEYLEAYQDAMEDGIITEKERRLLNKLMKINNISEQRAREIEQFY